MKKALLSLACFALSLSYSYSQSFHAIENFDNGSGGFTVSGSASAQPWALTSNYSVSSPNSYLGKIPTTSGYSIVLTSPVYDLADYYYVYLHFDHICKVEMTDTICIEYAEEMAGVFSNWKPLPAFSYAGSSGYYNPLMGFNETSYPEWDVNRNTNPSPSWWKHEKFDLYSVVGGAKVQFRFIIKKGNSPLSYMRYGWLIDNIEVVGEHFELKTPIVEFINPITDTVVTAGPFDITAKVKTSTSYPIKQPYLVYTSKFENNPSVTDSVLMNHMSGDSLWRGTIPTFIVGTNVTYYIIGEDALGNQGYITDSYYIKTPLLDTNSVELASFDSPLQWEVTAGTLMNIDITIRNAGIKNLDSIRIDWSVNGVSQPTFKWSNAGGLPWDFTESITIGTYTPRLNMYDTIIVQLSMPNGVVDPKTSDDRRVIILYGCSGSFAGDYIVGPNAGANYATLDEIFAVIRNCYLADDVVIKMQSGTYSGPWNITNLENAVQDKTITITSLSGNRGDVLINYTTPYLTYTDAGIKVENTKNLILDAISVNTVPAGINGIYLNGKCENITINNCSFKIASGYGAYATNSIRAKNLTIKNSLFDGTNYGIFFTGGSSGNEIDNLIIDSNEFINVSTNSAMQIAYTKVGRISYNKITANPTAGSTWRGIYLMYCPRGGDIVGNKIYATRFLTNQKTGIEINSNTDSVNIINNEIHLATTSTSVTSGIYFNGTRTYNCIHNTILLTGNGVHRVINQAGNAATNMSMKNNLFISTSTNASSYALFLAGAYSTAHQIDNNSYYSSVPLASIGGANKTSLSEIQATITSDRRSVNLLPDFVDSIVNLELVDYNPFNCAVLANVTTDITKIPRIGTTSMGCYGAIYQANATLVEVLNWAETPMANNTDSISVVLRNGGNSALTAATIKYTMNNGTTYSVNWSGSLTSNQTTTVRLGQVTYQNRFNNLTVYLSSSTPADGLLLDDTLRVGNYACNGALPAGTYTVGSAPTNDFTDMNHVALHLTQCGIAGPVTINFANGTYNQNVNIGNIPGSSATNTVTIASISGNRENVIFQRMDNGSVAGAPIMLKGASNIIFKNVSFSGVSPVSGATHTYAYALTIERPSQNITIDNCHLYIPDASGQTEANHIVVKANLVTSGISILNSLIEGGFTGIRIEGEGNSIRTTNVTIRNNTIAKVNGHGVYVYRTDAYILQNTITQRIGENTTNMYGVYSLNASGNIVGNKIRIATVDAGIYTSFFYSTAQRGNICNNEIIANVRNSSSLRKSGIFLADQSYANVWHNSIYVEATYATTNATQFVAGIQLNTSNASSSIRNNNIITDVKSPNYPLYMTASQGVFWNVGGNNYYSSTGVIGFALGEVVKSLDEWKRIVLTDRTSVSMLPPFIDFPNSLDILDPTGLTCAMEVSDDINNITRVNPTAIGAYHYVYTNNDAKPYALVSPTIIDLTIPAIGKLTILNLGLDTLRNIMIGYKLNGTTIGTQPWTGALAPNEISDTITLNTPFTPIRGENSLTIYTYSPNGQTDGFVYNDTLISKIYACDGGPLNGAYTINSDGSEDFETITEAINVLTNCGVSAPVTFNIASGVYNESPILRSFPGASATNTVTFTSSTANSVTINGGTTGLTLTDVSHVYFKDISIFGSNRSVQFENTCENIEFRGCNILSDTTATGSSIKCISYENTAGSGNRLNNVRLINNNIRGGYHGIYFVNTGSDNSTMGQIIIDSNIMEKAYAYGVYIDKFTFLESLSKNIINTRNVGTAQRAVYLRDVWITGKMDGNKMTLYSTASPSYIVQLLNVNTGSDFYNTYGNAVITNNELIKFGSASYGQGFQLDGTNADILHNSVYLSFGTGGNGSALHLVSVDRSLRIKNNIFVSQGTATTSDFPRAISGSTLLFSRDAGTEIDYNNYYSNGKNLAEIMPAPAYVVNYDMATLRAKTGQDEHSTNILPSFVSTTNLELTTYAGFQVPGLSDVTEDINGTTRSQFTYMGAYNGAAETINDAKIVSFVGFDEAIAGSSCPISVVVCNNGNTFINPSSISISGSINGTTFGPVTAPTKIISFNQLDTIPLGMYTFNAGANSLVAAVTLAGDTNQKNDTLKASRNMCNQLIEGTYTVGSASSDYANFNAFWTTANSCEIGGDVTLQFVSNTYSGAMNLSNWDNISNGHSLTITSVAQHQDSVVFTHTAALMTFNRTSNIILDKITLNTNTGHVVQFTGNASNITIINSLLLANPVAADAQLTNVCINKGTTGTLDGLTLKNCTLRGGHFGIRLSGVDYNYVKNIKIDNNVISDQASGGIYSNYIRLGEITNNKITARSSSLTHTAWSGIFVQISRESLIIGSNKIFAGNSAIDTSLYGIRTQDLYVASIINNDIHLHSSADLVHGLNISTPKEVDILHNTVLISGSKGINSFVAAYLNVGSTAYSTSIYNNIFIAEGGFSPFAIHLAGSDYTSNLMPYYRLSNNVYYSSDNLGYVFGAIQPTMEAWNLIAFNDTNSVNARPTFVDMNQDLRIETNYDYLTDRLPQVGTDKDGTSRNPVTSRGAYEFSYGLADASLIQFIDVVAEVNQNIDVAVELMNLGTDPLTSATIKWTLNGQLQDSVVWSGNLDITEKETVSLGSALLTWGKNEIKAWVSTEYDINKTNDTTRIIFYPCSGTMSGTYSVGNLSSDFETVKDALTALNTCGISGAVTLELASGTYPDIALLSSITGMSTTNTLTFTSANRNANSVVIATDHVGVILRDIDNLRFENLTIDATAGLKGFQFLSACSDIEIRNCRILLNPSATSDIHVGISKANTTRGVDRIRIINNVIDGGFYGIYFYGGTGSALYGEDIIIDSNTIRNNNGEGIRVLYSNLTSLSYNRVEATNNIRNTWYGIYLDYTNGIVNANRIVQNNLTNLPRGLHLRYFNTYLTNSTGLVSNNEIILNGASNTSSYYGIYAESNITANIINNSVLVSGGGGIAIYLGDAAVNFNVQNNIFTALTTNVPIHINSLVAAGSANINYNNYYSTGGNIGNIVGASPTTRTTLSNWRSIVVTDISSDNAEPMFIDANRSLELSDNILFYTVGHPQVQTDIDGKARTAYTTKGAYGFSVREGYDLELKSLIAGSGNEQDICKEDFIPVKCLIRNGGNSIYDFSVEPMDLHLSMTSPDGLLDFDTVVTINTGNLDVFLMDTFVITNNLNVTFAGDYHITAWLSSVSDTIYSNDTLKVTYLTNKVRLPFDDNFSTNTLEHIRIDSLHGTKGMWKAVQSGYDNIIQPAFGTGKLVLDDPDGNVSVIRIGQLELNRTVEPKLEFWYAHDNNHSDRDDLMSVKINYGGTDSTLQTIYRYDANYSQPTWVKYSFDLSHFQNASCVTVYLEATSRGTSQHIDRILIRSNQDVGISEITTSQLSACNLNNQKLNIVISNETNQDFDFDLPQNQTNVHIEVKINGSLQHTFDEPISGLLAGLSTIEVPVDFDYTLGAYEVTASLQMATVDANTANNAKSITFSINPSIFVTLEKMSDCQNNFVVGGTDIEQTVTVINTGNIDLTNINLILNVHSDSYNFQTTGSIDILHPGESKPYAFANKYKVPMDMEYHIDLTAYLSCDSTSVNADTSITECVDDNDLYIVDIINPKGGTDKVGDTVNLKVSVGNHCMKDFDDVEITALIVGSDGIEKDRINGTIERVGMSDTIIYDFSRGYIVPAITNYKVIVYFKNVDGYSLNDTMSISRTTNHVGIQNVDKLTISMEQNFPNPANNNTIIRYSIPKDGEVNFKIYGVNGQLLYNKAENASFGKHELEINTSTFASGIYFYTMEFEGQRLTKRMSIKR